MALVEETLVPLYLHHRYQVEAVASALGGLDYHYAVRGDGRTPWSFVTADKQQAARSTRCSGRLRRPSWRSPITS